MIHVDTSFLIPATAPATPAHQVMRRWLAGDEEVNISAPVLAEFLCGPMTPEQATFVAAAFPYPAPFEAQHATIAAQLFNVSGRRRGQFTDCMIAAIAIQTGASLATANVSDFERFQAHGLRLLPD